MWFLDFPPKKVQRCKFSWILALVDSSYDNFIIYRKFKMADFWKKALKLPKFQKPISQEPFRVRQKKMCSLLFLISRTFEQNLIKIWHYGWHWLCLIDVESPFCEWVQVWIDVYIPKVSGQASLSPWFSAACVAASL